MPFDGSGNFNRVMNWVSDALANIKIVASRHDSEDDNFASGLSNCITKDGQTQPTANIPMNGKRLLNLGNPTTGTDGANRSYVDTGDAAVTAAFGAADALLAPKANPTFTGKVTLPTGVAGTPPVNWPKATANPTSPAAGDAWPDVTTGRWQYRLTASTITFGALELVNTWTAIQTFSAIPVVPAGSWPFASILPAAVATAAELQAFTASKLVAADVVASAMAWFGMTDAATVVVNHASGVNQKVTLGGNRAFGTPSNAKVGMPLNIWVVQDVTGTRVPTWAAEFDFGDYGVPGGSVGANQADLYSFICLTTTKFAFLGIRKRVD